MANWKEQIKLNAVLRQAGEEHDLSRHEEDAPESVKESIASEIEKAASLREFAPSVRRSKSIAELNRVIRCIYDTADERLVWCGL